MMRQQRRRRYYFWYFVIMIIIFIIITSFLFLSSSFIVNFHHDNKSSGVATATTANNNNIQVALNEFVTIQSKGSMKTSSSEDDDDNVGNATTTSSILVQKANDVMLQASPTGSTTINTPSPCATAKNCTTNTTTITKISLYIQILDEKHVNLIKWLYYDYNKNEKNQKRKDSTLQLKICFFSWRLVVVQEELQKFLEITTATTSQTTSSNNNNNNNNNSSSSTSISYCWWPSSTSTIDNDDWMILVPSSAFIHLEHLKSWVVQQQQQQQEATLLYHDLPKNARDWVSQRQRPHQKMEYVLVVPPPSPAVVTLQMNRTCLLSTNQWKNECLNNSTSSSKSSNTTMMMISSLKNAISDHESHMWQYNNDDFKNNNTFWIYPNQFPFGAERFGTSIMRVLQLQKEQEPYDLSWTTTTNTTTSSSICSRFVLHNSSPILESQRYCELIQKDFRNYIPIWEKILECYYRRMKVDDDVDIDLVQSHDDNNNEHNMKKKKVLLLPTQHHIPAYALSLPHRIDKTKKRMDLYLPHDIFSPRIVISGYRGNSTYLTKDYGIEGYRLSYQATLQRALKETSNNNNTIFLVLDDDFRIHVNFTSYWNQLTTNNKNTCFHETLNGGVLLLGAHSFHQNTINDIVKAVGSSKKNHEKMLLNKVLLHDNNNSLLTKNEPSNLSCLTVYRGVYGSHATIWSIQAAKYALEWLNLTSSDRAFDAIWADLQESSSSSSLNIRILYNTWIAADVQHSSSVDTKRHSINVTNHHLSHGWDLTTNYIPESGEY